MNATATDRFRMPPPVPPVERQLGPALARLLAATLAALLGAAAALASPPSASAPAEELARGFLHPPPAARPWVYWFPLSGNLTREGITLDLEAMARVGIGGVLIMEVDQGAPAGEADFAGPRWRELFAHACREAARLGLRVNMNNDAGWCGSGGPWISPELAMQKVVWSEREVEGPSRFEDQLPPPPATAGYYRDIALLALPVSRDTARIDDIAHKAVFASRGTSFSAPASWPEAAPGRTVPRSSVVDLTSRLDAEGKLAWDVPKGRWLLLRLGHTPTGQQNRPAPATGRGLECDKLSRRAVRAHFEGLIGKLAADVGPLAGRTFVSTHIDSWEVGVQNWTPGFRAAFRARRGYDILPFLPVMTGRVVESVEVSERFLWDLRKTISELLLENYAGTMRELAHRHGLRLSIEAYNTCPTDELAYAGRADEPMGEFWSWGRYGAAFSVVEMASAAHVWGRPVVGAEAFTASSGERWLGHPGNIKDLGDWAFTLGINRFVFHRYALQPWRDRRPGMSMGPWGLHYERTQTWWEKSGPWHEYLARCQFLLRQGVPVADLCLLMPEGSPQSANAQASLASASAGGAGGPIERPRYGYDLCPAEVVLTRMEAKEGRLVLPDGPSYRLLALSRARTMTPRLLERIAGLVRAGATVVGEPPVASPSLEGYPRSDGEVRRLAAELWGEPSAARPLEGSPRAGGSPFLEHRLGRGRVLWRGAEERAENSEQLARRALLEARWIWSEGEGDPTRAVPAEARRFRRSFTVPAGRKVRSAWLVLTADNTFRAWIDGRPAGRGDDFHRLYARDVTGLLSSGDHVLAVEATNITSSPNPAALIGVLRVELEEGAPLVIATDGRWRWARPGGGDWTRRAGPAKGWRAAREIGPPGMAPWGPLEGTSSSSRDLVADIASLEELLAALGLPPDFTARTRPDAAAFRYTHRRAGSTDLYFVANARPRPEWGLCTFRVEGRRPELWWPETGRRERPALWEARGGAVRLPLLLASHESVFVVFPPGSPPDSDPLVSVRRDGVPLWDARAEAAAAVPEGEAGEAGQGSGDAASARAAGSAGSALPSLALERAEEGGIDVQVARAGSYELRWASGRRSRIDVASLPEPIEVEGPWAVRFAPGGGAPDRIELDRLVWWSEHPDPGVRHFSGTATYRARFTLPPALVGADRRLLLELGRVEVVAEAWLNGERLGILWKAPFRADITRAAREGENELRVEVTNLWVNRLIGDESLPEDSPRRPNGTLEAWPPWLAEGKPSPTGRFTFTSWRLWKKGDPLQPSGLLGPVRVRAIERRRLEVSARTGEGK